MRVMMVTGSVSRRAGGLYTSVRRLSQALSDRGIEIRVVSFADPDTITDLSAWLPLEPIIMPAGTAIVTALMRGVGHELAVFRPDVIHQHGIWLPFSARVSWEATNGTPVMISPRGMLDRWALANSAKKKWFAWNLYERRNLQGARCLHALAEAEFDAIRSKLPKARIATIPNGIDVPDDYLTVSRDRRAGRITTKNPRRILLYIGRIHPKKGLRELVEAWANLGPNTRARWQVIVAGPDEGGHRREVEALAASRGVAGDVHFVGPVFGREKTEWLRRASAFVLPSKSEGLPMSVLEAWAHGLPVLMTPACNLPEGFELGAALKLDPFAVSLESALAQSDAELAAIGVRGRNLVRERFTWPRIAAEHASVYKWMMGAGERPSCVSS